MENLAQPLLDFIQAHQGWAIAVMFVTAFGESFVFLGLLFPGTTLLIAAGTLIKAGALPMWPILVGAIIGATLGDGISYWLGYRFGGSIGSMWPFSRNPNLLSEGMRFFERHGGKSVFVGRFFGPVRAVIPLAAGIMRMSQPRFWLANITSALVWAPMLLFAGDVIGQAGEHLFGATNTVVLVVGGLTVFGIAAAIWALFRASRSRT
jgi:undecaprenyl-diphosphatase